MGVAPVQQESPMYDDFSDMDKGSISSKHIEEISPLTSKSMQSNQF